jgi:hypothetical protein
MSQVDDCAHSVRFFNAKRRRFCCAECGEPVEMTAAEIVQFKRDVQKVRRIAERRGL